MMSLSRSTRVPLLLLRQRVASPLFCSCRSFGHSSSIKRSTSSSDDKESTDFALPVERKTATWEDIEKARHWPLVELERAFTLPLLKEYATRRQLKRTGSKKELIDRIRASWGQKPIRQLSFGIHTSSDF